MARPTKAVTVARDLLDECEVRKAPVDLDRVVNYLSVDVRYAELEEVSGLTFHSDRGNRILVNSSHAPTRRRFTLAHELGHHLLHPGHQLVVDSDVRVSRRDATSSLATQQQEIEANAFAAELLMPREFVRDHLSTLVGDSDEVDREQIVSELAGRFDVSQQAMEYRLINLGILPVHDSEDES